MPVPSFVGFIEPLLRHLARNPKGVQVRDAYEAVADVVKLAAEQRALFLPSGRQAIYKNRIGWAQDRLKRDGLSGSPSRGLWTITQRGIALVAKHPVALPEAEVQRLAYPEPGSTAAADGQLDGAATVVNMVAAASTSPEERIDEAVAERHRSTATDLLERVLQASPAFFERLVLKLLLAMGYGATQKDLHNVGGPGDGGIDGIISLDRLGLEKVYIQAKRWQNKCSRPQIQEFYGALAGRRARKGVFITTSSFTKEAQEYADQVSDSIVLVDGARLTTLMIEHDVGVQHTVHKLATVDSDFFDDA